MQLRLYRVAHLGRALVPVVLHEAGVVRPINRIQPQGPVNVYKTYSITRPMVSHWRKATCEEVECRAHVNGWQTFVDESTDEGAAQAYYIRRESGRGFTETINEHGITELTFGAGQTCFDSASEAHRVSLDREAFYAVQGGDWRQRIGQKFTHATPDSWVNDFGEHQDQLARRQ